MTWYNNDQGFEAQKPKNKYIKRFWMPNDSDRLITFVDEPVITLNSVQVNTPFLYNEYTINLNGHWRNWFTQPFDKEQDVLAQMEYKPSKVAAITVVDHAEWQDKKGNVHKDELALYVIKRSSPIWKQLTKLIERHKSLAGKTFRIHRMGAKSYACGSMLEKHEQDFVLAEEHKPFNYLEILKPKTKEELEALFAPAPDVFSSNTQQQSNGIPNGWQSQPQTQQQAWASQPQTQQQSWGTQPNQDHNPNQHRTYGATTGDDPIPF